MVPAYGFSVFLFSFFVHVLIIMGTNQLFSCRSTLKNTIFAALLGSTYSGVCLLAQRSFWGEPRLRILCLVVMALIAFGFTCKSLPRGIVFVALSLAAGSVVQPSKNLNPWLLLMLSVGVLFYSLSGQPIGKAYIPVELSYGKNKLCLTALRDTGNTLRDPVTGKPVLILGADVAEKLTGLSSQQLRQPVETMGKLPGLRLIPYKSIGGSGLLLALHMPNVRIGTWHGSGLVAFAPEVLNINGTYQALTGGMV